ncbi:MAG: HAMP domain-containing histidine kinase [Bacteroidetes bacterium]|nr:HAMP domain-containing histidine kinase [Bacteroidota bacterium]
MTTLEHIWNRSKKFGLYLIIVALISIPFIGIQSQNRLADSLKNVIVIERTLKENEKLKMDLMMAESKARLQKTIIISGVIISILGSVITLVLYFSNKNIRIKNLLLHEQNKEIQAQNEEIQAQNEEIRSQREQLQFQNDFLEGHNKQLSELNREKDSLISIVAHDLRAPLNRTKGLSIILQSTPLSEEQLGLVKLLTQINEDGLHLIKDILQANTIDEERPEPTTVDLGVFINDHINKYFKEQSQRKNIPIFCRVEKGLEITTDALALRRVIDNLISNALKFSLPGAIIFVRILSVDQAVYICVQDQGPGISKADQQKLFRKFQKLSARPTSGEPSTGLGLAIVKGLVERLKGEISVNSELGKGAEFVIRLPRQLKTQNPHDPSRLLAAANQ